MAEAIARRVAAERGIADVVVSSAGTGAWEGSGASEGALLVAERLRNHLAALVHEATFARPEPVQWHSTAREAGRVARAAGVRRLYLAHVGYTVHGALRAHVAAARAGFGGTAAMVEELRWYRV